MNTRERKQRRTEIKAQHALDELAMLKNIRQSRREKAQTDQKAKRAALADQRKRARTISAQKKTQAAKNKYGKKGKPSPVIVADLDTGEIRRRTTEKKLREPAKLERRRARIKDEYAKGIRKPRPKVYALD